MVQTVTHIGKEAGVKSIARKWRMRLALMAALPVAAAIALFGASSTAYAHTLQTSCSSFHICYYADANFSPTSSILNVGQEDISDWTTIADTGRVCGGIISHTWNDCVSSIKDRMSTFYMCNYQNSGFSGNFLEAAPGEQFVDLVNNNFNDEISSNKFVSSTTPC